jgi:hypothetical protein
MIKIYLAETSELARYPARSSVPKVINKKVITYKNFDIPKKEGIYFMFDKDDIPVDRSQIVREQHEIMILLQSKMKEAAQ